MDSTSRGSPEIHRPLKKSEGGGWFPYRPAAGLYHLVTCPCEQPNETRERAKQQLEKLNKRRRQKGQKTVPAGSKITSTLSSRDCRRRPQGRTRKAEPHLPLPSSLPTSDAVPDAGVHDLPAPEQAPASDSASFERWANVSLPQAAAPKFPTALDGDAVLPFAEELVLPFAEEAAQPSFSSADAVQPFLADAVLPFPVDAPSDALSPAPEEADGGPPSEQLLMDFQHWEPFTQSGSDSIPPEWSSAGMNAADADGVRLEDQFLRDFQYWESFDPSESIPSQWPSAGMDPADPALTGPDVYVSQEPLQGHPLG
ncbi:hypothetical protein PsYK624_103240 [Phanerochaete sordida]|uniref:Uncharacterized protein n=1 Tax=Phanerochaete sordida TaxID=48140 RepID=A0A9P3GG38_9APHY|nr:hypothetical protein PsYK624_103240 [Phanerochaete sordida]